MSKDVLVVGTGPTGLVLAAHLLSRGIATRIINKAAGPSPQSRALGVHARTLEMLEALDLADAFIDHGHRVRRFRMYARGRTLLNLNMSRNGSRYGFILHLPQGETEKLLRSRVRELGGIVEDGVELVRLDQEGDAVHTTIRDQAGRESTVTAGHVVGCDGAHSRVRHELGVSFEGRPYAEDWLLADVVVDGSLPEDETHGFFRSDGLPVVCLPMGAHRWRVVMPNVGDRSGSSPSLAEMQGLVDQRAPMPLRLSDPTWLASFRCHVRSTRTYRSGRVFLAGDAAHIHSPAGAQGMNTGMMDSENLALKLALVAGGQAPESLLDSYGQERIPVAYGVLSFTDKIVRMSTMRNPVAQAARDTLLPMFTSLPTVQKRTARRLSQMSVARVGVR